MTDTMATAAELLRHLPARQRAVVVLREVLGWQTDEVADLLGTTTASVERDLRDARNAIVTR